MLIYVLLYARTILLRLVPKQALCLPSLFIKRARLPKMHFVLRGNKSLDFYLQKSTLYRPGLRQRALPFGKSDAPRSI